MAFPNTHAFAFTQMPRSLTKTWQKACFRGTDVISSIPNHHRHRHSSVARITLSVEFDQIANFMASECARMDDDVDDAIELWKEHRNLWRDLERSVEEQISNYVMQVQSLAESTSERYKLTYEAPVALKTEIERYDSSSSPTNVEPEYSPTIRPSAPTIMTLPTESVLAPDDSASSAGQSYLKEIITSEVEKAIKSTTERIRDDLKTNRGAKEKKHGRNGSSPKTGKSKSRTESVVKYLYT